ncbi:TIGR02452 family protein [Brevibacillus sp. NPDC058079]|uniref:TIGR02452 family protein n=1 Tax=Brevibacillus sp. NPDC058079 TaxID=3346330 RepID=UPI0036F0F131
MSKREKMVEIAEDTLRILELGSYQNSKGNQVEVANILENAVRNSVLYRPDMESKIEYDTKQILKYSPSFQTVIEVTSETSLEATKRLTKEQANSVVCLNFASARTPGGGFKKGASAQEESIARSSGLFPCISQMREMYDHNRQVLTGFYSDYMIFSPDVPVFKDDTGKLLDEFYTVSFITAPAVNAGVVKDKAWNDRHMILDVMKRRIEKILSLAILHQQEVVVLGAFGCGVFKNEPKDIATLFKEVLEDERFKHSFKKITFAVYDPSPTKENLLPFVQVLSNRNL